MRGSAALLLLALVMAGCGWHPRGSGELPRQLQELRLSSEPQSAAFAQKLRRSMRRAGMQLVEGSAPYTLKLGAEEKLLRKVSLDRSGRAAEQEMRLMIDFELRDGEGVLLYGPQRLSSSRIYAYDPNQVIAKRDEERLIYIELQNNLVAQLFRQLSRIDASRLQPGSAATP